MTEKKIGEDKYTSGMTQIEMTVGTDTYNFISLNANPPGYQGSNAVKVTNNDATPLVASGKVYLHEYKPGKFVEVTPISGVASYDPGDEVSIQSILQIEGSLKVTFNTGESASYSSAWLVKFTPQGKSVVDGEEQFVADYEVFINAKGIYAAAPTG